MRRWKDISLYKYQKIEAVNASKMEDVDKVLMCVCHVFGITEHELDNMNPRKASRLVSRLTKIMQSKIDPKPCKRIGKYFINYDISKITFGQYIELSFFFQGNAIMNAHYILSSVSNKIFKKNNSSEHRHKSDYFLKQPITKVVGSLKLLTERMTEFNKEYAGLFGLSEGVHDPSVKVDKFNKRYGWVYSASQVAEYERITLDQAMRLPVRQALTGLSYLKAKGEYEAEQINKK